MSLKEKFKKGIKEYKQSRTESRTFKRIVAKRQLQARRQSYEEEAVKQATIKGKQLAERKANKPTFGQRVSSFTEGIDLPKRAVSMQRAVSNQRAVSTQRVEKRKKRRTKKRRTKRAKKTAQRSVEQRGVPTTQRPVEQRRDPFAPTMNWGL